MSDEVSINPSEYIPLERAKLIRFAVDCDNATHNNFTSTAFKLDLHPQSANIIVTTPLNELVERDWLSVFVTDSAGTRRAVLGPSIPSEVNWPVDPRQSFHELLRDLRSGSTTCELRHHRLPPEKTTPDFWNTIDGEQAISGMIYLNSFYWGSEFFIRTSDILKYLDLGGPNSFRARRSLRSSETQNSISASENSIGRLSGHDTQSKSQAIIRDDIFTDAQRYQSAQADPPKKQRERTKYKTVGAEEAIKGLLRSGAIDKNTPPKAAYKIFTEATGNPNGISGTIFARAFKALTRTVDRDGN